MKVKNLSLSAGTVATNTSVGPYIDSYQVQTLSEGYAPYLCSTFIINSYDEAGKPVEGAYLDVNGDGQINSSDLYRYHSRSGLHSRFQYFTALEKMDFEYKLACKYR